MPSWQTGQKAALSRRKRETANCAALKARPVIYRISCRFGPRNKQPSRNKRPEASRRTKIGVGRVRCPALTKAMLATPKSPILQTRRTRLAVVETGFVTLVYSAAVVCCCARSAFGKVGNKIKIALPLMPQQFKYIFYRRRRARQVIN